jgi:hypothetical protein
MSEADRVFARMTTPGTHPAPEDKQFLHITARRRGTVAGQSRVVEVVHRRSDRAAPPVEPANPTAQSAHAATWPEGFRARPAPPVAESPAASADPAPQIGHVMPGWEPLLAPAEPAEPPDKSPAGPQPSPKAAKSATRRAFADPFAATDTGANCIRCGYLVEPVREERGLLTCKQCR